MIIKILFYKTKKVVWLRTKLWLTVSKVSKWFQNSITLSPDSLDKFFCSDYKKVSIENLYIKKKRKKKGEKGTKKRKKNKLG